MNLNLRKVNATLKLIEESSGSSGSLSPFEDFEEAKKPKKKPTKKATKKPLPVKKPTTKSKVNSQPAKRKKVEESGDESEDQKEKLTLPGQKHPTPPATDATRVFYESLLRQKPSSIMAQEWCLKYGLLSSEEAKKVAKSLAKHKAAQKSK